jgi:hypothetical protein
MPYGGFYPKFKKWVYKSLKHYRLNQDLVKRWELKCVRILGKKLKIRFPIKDISFIVELHTKFGEFGYK